MAGEICESRDHHTRRCRPIENPASASAHDDRVEAAQPQGGIAMRAIDRVLESVQLECERRVVDACRWNDLRSEHAHAQPAKASQRAEPVTLSPRELDGGGPVGSHPELHGPDTPAPLPGDKHHWHPFERPRPALEQALCAPRSHSPDIDSVDTDSCGESLG